MTECNKDCGHHEPPCEHLNNLEHIANEKLDLVIERMDELALRQAAMAERQASMAEIIDAWDNTKGFIRTVQIASKILRWITMTGAAIAGIWYLLQNGSWPK